MQKRGNVILNEEFTEIYKTYPEFSETAQGLGKNNGDLALGEIKKNYKKTQTEIELKRKQETKLIGKLYEKKMHKEYTREVTDNSKLISVTPDSSFTTCRKTRHCSRPLTFASIHTAKPLNFEQETKW